ncbi:DUF2842 domain-containing protein [Frigidibacter sp. RF13]|uniref:DUF2842 domain-containing protein n=1 Tax=Frigidibacter sp. RF13 TaxID=2997340 RepID=UPI00226F5B0C|nr:DUF2842 domain-containing protein [Frigidibacter sp. RF13]MCY1126918.1 DUF2842 domain-containing protein [Frigidibacter sp. RF13]
MTHRTRKRLALLALLVGLPIYVVLAVSLVNWLDQSFGRLPIWAEVPLYAVLAFAWALPLKPLFRGIGQADPED